MKFQVNGRDLNQMVRHLAPIARSSKEIANKRIRIRHLDNNILELAAAGGAVNLRMFANYSGDYLQSDIVVEAEVFRKTVNQLKGGNIEFAVGSDNAVVMSVGNFKVTLPELEGPVLSDRIRDMPTLTIPASVFAKVMSEALPYASTEDNRPALRAVFIDCAHTEFHVTATDGHRLFSRSFGQAEWAPEVELAKGISLPVAAVKTALKLLRSQDGVVINIFLGDAVVIEQAGVFRIDAEPVSAEFPDFRQCVPSHQGIPVAQFEVCDLKAALAAGAPFLSRSSDVSIVYEDGLRLQVCGGNAGSFVAEIGGKFDGPRQRVRFNLRYIEQMCKTLAGTVRQFVTDGLAPQVFVENGDEEGRMFVIVMPMRP